jgi:hypothetical protein
VVCQGIEVSGGGDDDDDDDDDDETGQDSKNKRAIVK